MNPLIQKMFENRGYTQDYINTIDDASHDTLKDIDVLCHKLYEIKQAQKHIVVLPDFDMDGIMSGVIGFAGLSELGFRASLFIPDPADGYGVSVNTIDQLMEEYSDVDAILTCDVGITCFEAIEEAKKRGLTVLITDHHKQNIVDDTPDCIVDPMRLDETYSHPYICGAHVLLQCLQFYADTHCSVMVQSQIKRLCVFAGIGTISDCMPLLYENRQLVRDAVSILRLFADGGDRVVNYMGGSPVYRRAFHGLHILLTALSEGKTIDSDFIGFYLAPVFNSVKRLEGDMHRAFGVFFQADTQDCIDYLIDLNEQRKAVVAQYFDDLMVAAQPYAPYIYFSDAPKGVLGLLAQKCCSSTGVPSIVVAAFADSETSSLSFSGSARSPEWYSALTKARDRGICANGHEPAFGIYFEQESELEAFFSFLSQDVPCEQSSLTEQRLVSDFVISVDGDGDTGIDTTLFSEYLRELEDYRPFGSGFESPVVLFKFRPHQGNWQVIGSNRNHLRISFDFGFQALFWNQADLSSLSDEHEVCYAIGHLERNCFRGVSSIQFIGELVDGEVVNLL